MRDTWHSGAQESWQSATGLALWTPEREAKLCDMIAEGENFTAVASCLGVTRNSAKSRFDRIRRKYGWQAQ